jgi:hypothetical protein
MESAEIRQYFDELNDELRAQDVKGEICMYGGAVMCLVYQTRPATKDVDAIFEPVKQIRNAAQRVAENHGLEKDWLNSAVKMFLVPHEREVLIDLSHLKIYMPTADYLLAMKALAARANTSDRADLEFLVAKLELSDAAEAIAIVEKYYPHKQIKPATQFLLEEIFEQRS